MLWVRYEMSQKAMCRQPWYCWRDTFWEVGFSGRTLGHFPFLHLSISHLSPVPSPTSPLHLPNTIHHASLWPKEYGQAAIDWDFWNHEPINLSSFKVYCSQVFCHSHRKMTNTHSKLDGWWVNWGMRKLTRWPEFSEWTFIKRTHISEFHFSFTSAIISFQSEKYQSNCEGQGRNVPIVFLLR